MSLMELGAIGEFVAALGVFVTLIYLARQVRHARSDVQLSAQHARLQAIRDNWLNRSRNAELLDAIIKAEDALGVVFLENGFVQALIEQGGLSRREAYLVHFDQQIQWQNWVHTAENIEDQSPGSIARMDAGIRRHYKHGYGRLFWERQRDQGHEKAAIAYFEKVLKD
jgi:hypothetical protein